MESEESVYKKDDRQKISVPIEGTFVFGNKRLNKRTVLLAMNLVITSLVGFIFLLSQPVMISSSFEKPAFEKTSYPTFSRKANNIEIEVASTQELMQRLKEYNLWEISQLKQVPPVVINGFPTNFHELADQSLRKKMFLHTLLPAVLIALQEIQLERANLMSILKKIDRHPRELDFSKKNAGWGDLLTANEIDFIDNLARKYRTPRAAKLLNRVDVVPISLVLGQGAIESSWGRSRFARKVNNIFGMWTWGEKGIVPAEREEGKKHKIMVYDSILESVRSYVLTLNRLSAYSRLRELRRQSSDSLMLAEGLTYYSERRERYVEDLRRLIHANDLKSFDRLMLTVMRPQQRTELLKSSELKPKRTYIAYGHNANGQL